MAARVSWCLAVAASLLLAAGCNQQAAFERSIPAAEAAFGRQVFEQLQRRQFGAVEAVLSPAASGGEPVRPRLERVAAMFPSDAPTSVRVIGAATNMVNGNRLVQLTYEYQYPRRWVVANIALRQAAGHQVVERLNAQPTLTPQATVNAFTLGGKRLRHYVMLTATVAVPLFVLGTFVAVLRTHVPRRRWLWAVGVLLAIGEVSMNWTTGAVAFQPRRIGLLGAGFFKAGPYGPLTLMWLFPLGAIAFWWKRRDWLTDPPLEPSSDSVPDTPRE